MKLTKRLLYYFLTLVAVLGIAVGLFVMQRGYARTAAALSEKSEPATILSDKRVLFISSYDMTYSYVPAQIEGLNSVFKGANVDMDMAFMDTHDFSTPESLKYFYDSLSYKMKVSGRYDVIVAADDPALAFVREHQQELFDGIPVVFFGINDLDSAKSAMESPMMVGFPEYFFIGETIELARRFQPKATRLLVMEGDTLADKGNEKIVRSIMERHPEIYFSIIRPKDCTKVKLIEILESLTEDTILLCIGGYADDGGMFRTPPELTQFVSKYSANPVFTPIYSTVGNGFTGGRINTPRSEGVRAAKIACDIISSGKIPGPSDFDTIPTSTVLFDAKMMRKFGMDRSLLPPDAQLVNDAEGYFSRYRPILVPFIIIIASFLMLLVVAMMYVFELRDTRGRLKFELTHNPLTRLPNRRLAKQLLEKFIEQGREFSLVSLDIGGFRMINSYYSRRIGDKVLVEVARRLNSLNSMMQCTAFRFTSDEFMLILPDRPLSDSSVELYYIRQQLSDPFIFGTITIFLKASIGIANKEKGIFDPDYYFVNADIAMYAAKDFGLNKTVVFTAEMRGSLERQQELLLDLEYACQNDGFYVMFQPQVDVVTGMIHGYEALARLKIIRDGVEKNIAPTEFVPVAERSGAISKMSRIVTEKIISHMALWNDHGVDPHTVSINYSAAQMEDRNYVSFLRQVLDHYKVDPRLICIEITESVFLGNKGQAADLFNQLHEMGITLALDDFGTGYSSLSYLASLPFETVKLDKSLVDSYLSRTSSHDDKESFIRNIVNLVHSLQMKLTVEGIEEFWQYSRICDIGGDFIQGYYFSKPIMPEEVETYRPLAR